jgi:hypothetical protein
MSPFIKASELAYGSGDATLQAMQVRVKDHAKIGD